MIRCWVSAPESVKPTIILWNFRIQILVLLIKPSIFSVPRMINVTFHAPVYPKNLRSVGCHGILNILQIRWFKLIDLDIPTILNCWIFIFVLTKDFAGLQIRMATNLMFRSISLNSHS